MTVGRDEYIAKIAAFMPFEFQAVKSPVAPRESAAVKSKREGELLLRRIQDRDHVILFDEAGELARDSESFATRFRGVLASGKPRVVFCIGGPFGFSDEVRRRSTQKWSLSPLTMNHWVAQLSALEQIYRAFTIFKGIPYHNR